MNTINLKYLAISLVAIIVASCTTYDDLVKENTPTSDDIPPSSGDVSFVKYVALGNSQSAGFMDAALYDDGQANSFPAILSGQFAMAGGGAFLQPDINSVNGFNPLLSSPSLIVGKLRLDATTDPPSFIPAVPGEPIGDFTGDKASLNNFGVPGARVVDAVTPGYGNFNQYYSRFQSSSSASMLGDAVAANGSFFSLWLGSNDVLGYATSGGTDTSQPNPSVVPPDSIIVGIGPTGPVWAPNVAPGTPILLKDIPGITDYFATNTPASTNGQGLNPSEITDPTVFAGAYQQIMDALTGTSSFTGGVAINVTDITSIPFFNTVPAAALKLPFDLSAAVPPELGLPVPDLASAVNSIYAQFGFATDPTTGLPISQVFDSSPDNFLAVEAEDEKGNRVFRQLASDELVLLTVPLDSLVAGWGSLKGLVLKPDGSIDFENLDITKLRPFPIPSAYILDKVEITDIIARTAEFNDHIASIVSQKPTVELVDAHGIFETIKLIGVAPGSVPLSPDIGPAGMFSVDGIHTNQRGNAIIVNEIVSIINDRFGATLPLVDPWRFSPNDIQLF